MSHPLQVQTLVGLLQLPAAARILVGDRGEAGRRLEPRKPWPLSIAATAKERSKRSVQPGQRAPSYHRAEGHHIGAGLGQVGQLRELIEP